MTTSDPTPEFRLPQHVVEPYIRALLLRDSLRPQPDTFDTFAVVLTDDEAAAELARLGKPVEADPWRARRRRLQGEPDGD
jgi:hypothetical protein